MFHNGWVFDLWWVNRGDCRQMPQVQTTTHRTYGHRNSFPMWSCVSVNGVCFKRHFKFAKTYRILFIIYIPCKIDGRMRYRWDASHLKIISIRNNYLIYTIMKFGRRVIHNDEGFGRWQLDHCHNGATTFGVEERRICWHLTLIQSTLRYFYIFYRHFAGIGLCQLWKKKKKFVVNFFFLYLIKKFDLFMWINPFLPIGTHYI